MKKFLALVLAGCMALSLAACGGAASSSAATSEAASTEATAESSSGSKTDVAFVTDVGNIDDQSFNQYTWQGVQDFCAANGLNANYYRPTEDSDAARLEQMDNAVNDGAKAIVVAGYLFGTSIAEAQAKYPDVQFLALDVATTDLSADGSAQPAANTALITYKEEQAGYLAGYAAVYDGYKELGFLGGMAVPAVIRYGYGFVQGADAAAKELGETDVNIKYWYSGGFAATDEVKNKMDGWYSEGTEVVFACGGPVCQSCDAAAQANGGKMIGVDVDQSGQFDTVITSAMKALANSVNVALTDAMDNGWKFSDAYAGKQTVLGAAENCVGLPMETSKFTKFTQEQYDTMYQEIVDGTLVVDDSFDTAVTPAVTNVNVDYQG
ncbi:BMP family lipoprotein [Subdoligranulum variabile]|uniref:Basic membrane protein n=1 Tax=Subdoligranulum variabile DSM 15176 TaxID=411471 RepID=D1PMG4_9FIRM|nr:BMP family ABC transporter substrate-binding protein [Subdoligranulum variabile]EFB75750.1 basic membrane protein [Subdoligranulum variabile DSM 15176]UWP68443.1 BMP family ABC transporter substrate-binding protein [Subdoligranulum variabile]